MPTRRGEGTAGGPPRPGGAGFAWGATPLQPLERLGRGGMGEVWRARDPRLGREVAVKLLLGDARQITDSGSRRFRREGEISAALDHPNVLRVHEILEVGGRLALIYELVEGARPLDQAWGTELGGRVALIAQLARGLEHAHSQGIVHRDLKPENLLVDSVGVLRIADFGIAFRDSPERLTQSGAMVGTPCYMAPEQFSTSGSPAPSVDSWSVGVLLYVALTDELPFVASTLATLMAEVHGGLSSAARAQLKGQPQTLVRLIEACLRTTPSARPSAARIREALEAWDPSEARAGGGRAGALVGLGLLLALGAGAFAISSLRDTKPPPSATASQTPTPSAAVSEPSGPPPPPPALLADLRSPELSRSGFAALELLEGYAPGDYLEEARQRVQRLRSEPIQRLRYKLPSGVDKKDWEVGFAGGDPWDLVGLADGCGRMARWNLRSGELSLNLDLKWEWHSGMVQALGALTGAREDPGGSVLQFGHDGSGRRFLARADADFARIHAMLWARPEEVWVMAEPHLIRFEKGKETLRVRMPFRSVSGNLARTEDSLLVAIVSSESRADFFRLDLGSLDETSRAPDFERLASLEGDTVRLDSEARRGRLAISAGIEFALLEASGQRVLLRELPPVALRWKRVTWHPSGEWIWRWGVNPLNSRQSELQLLSAEDGALRAKWPIRFKVGSAKLSPDGRFAAFGSKDKARRGVAAEVFYVGKEVWD